MAIPIMSSNAITEIGGLEPTYAGGFRRCVTSLPVTVVAIPEGTHARGTRAGSLMHAMTASSFAAVSLDPLLLAVSVNKPGGMQQPFALPG